MSRAHEFLGLHILVVRSRFEHLLTLLVEVKVAPTHRTFPEFVGRNYAESPTKCSLLLEEDAILSNDFFIVDQFLEGHVLETHHVEGTAAP